MDALVAELKATQQERRQAEARVADLEGYERDLRDQRQQVERLRRVWAGWAAALDAVVPAARQILARQILRKILVGRIYVRPVRPGAWRFAGISRYDGALRGGLGRTGTTVLPGFGRRYDDFCQLMLHLLAEPESPADGDDQSRQQSLFGLCTEHRPRGPVDGARVARIIAGGSDAAGWDQTGRVSSGPPMKLARERGAPRRSRGATRVGGASRGPPLDQTCTGL
jgi:hypothetical protein